MMVADGKPFPSQLFPGLHDGASQGNDSQMRKPVELGPSFQPTAWPEHKQRWLRWHKDSLQKQKQSRSADASTLSNKKTKISIRDGDGLRRYYERAFENLQQTNCRVLAKAYVKLVEPRKQVNYPYNGRKIVAGSPKQLDPDETKPPWWPAGVIHREPDHLPKVGKGRSTLSLTEYS